MKLSSRNNDKRPTLNFKIPPLGWLLVVGIDRRWPLVVRLAIGDHDGRLRLLRLRRQLQAEKDPGDEGGKWKGGQENEFDHMRAVTIPFWSWYLPDRSAYVVAGTSPSKKTTWAIPSLA